MRRRKKVFRDQLEAGMWFMGISSDDRWLLLRACNRFFQPGGYWQEEDEPVTPGSKRTHFLFINGPT